MTDRKTRRERRDDLLQRYEKQRRRNLLAEPGCHDMVLVLDHLRPGFNVPKIFRSAEAFGVHEIHLVGIGPFDPAPAKGTFKQVPARFSEEIDGSLQDLTARGYTLFTLEACDGEPLQQAQLPRKSAFIFGHEERGLSFDPDQLPGIRRLLIPQYGKVESLNVSVAASIVMYEYVRQHGQEARTAPPRPGIRRVQRR